MRGRCDGRYCGTIQAGLLRMGAAIPPCQRDAGCVNDAAAGRLAAICWPSGQAETTSVTNTKAATASRIAPRQSWKAAPAGSASRCNVNR